MGVFVCVFGCGVWCLLTVVVEFAWVTNLCLWLLVGGVVVPVYGCLCYCYMCCFACDLLGLWCLLFANISVLGCVFVGFCG